MKKVFPIIILCFLAFSGFSKNPEEKTFLVIFDKSHLKEIKTSTDYIELSLLNLFSTKAYNGNSDAAILVKIPNENFDTNQLGDMLIRLNANKVTPLSEIAVQIIDLGESKSTYSSLLASYEERMLKTKKANKAIKATPAP
jgi:putative ribosome biogenesis GTPase RsgA